MLGQFNSGDDFVVLRRFVGLTQAQFAAAMGISVHTLRNWCYEACPMMGFAAD